MAAKYQAKGEEKPSDLMFVAAVAKRLGLSEVTVRDYSNQGRIKHTRTTSGHRLYRRVDIERYAAEREARHQEEEHGDGTA
jgi:DNA-binding transcriptional MerR regulator